MYGKHDSPCILVYVVIEISQQVYVVDAWRKEPCPLTIDVFLLNAVEDAQRDDRRQGMLSYSVLLVAHTGQQLAVYWLPV